MITWLRSIRLTWAQIALIAATSALATALIIKSSTAGQHLSYSALAALRQRVAVHTTPIATPAPSAASAPPSVAPATAAPEASAAQSPAGISTPTPDSSGSGPSGPSAPSAPSGGSDGSGTTGTTGTGTSATPAGTTRAVGHVFVIALTTPSYRAAFGPGSVAHYLNRKLRRRGVLLSGYRTLGGSELPDYLAMVSGQAPNADTRAECGTYAEFPSSATPLATGQVPGAGCVYPNTVLTIGDQVTAAGKQWKAYLADMGASACMHPNSNAADDAPLPGAGSQYATRHNPFVYFHSLLDLGGCASDDVGLQHLAPSLRSAARTPTYAFIAPGLCAEPGAGPCPGGQPSGLAAEDAFLKRWVPAITASPAYKQGGVLMIVFAKAPTTGAGSSRTGALILSPYAKAGSAASSRFTPYSVLRSTEDLLGYTPLVHAKSAKSFAATAAPAN